MILGGLGTIASIYPSDERVKEDIEPIGKTFDGQNIYKFRYKGQPGKQIGLVAQDVEKKHPDAVYNMGGLKAVDYDSATKDSASMGGVVHPSMERQNFAQGGLGMVPYEDFAEGYGGLSYVPKSKIPVGGQRGIPEAPKPYEEKGLSSVWDEIKGMNEKQLANLKSNISGLGKTVESWFTPDMALAHGGLARGHYADGGGPTSIIPSSTGVVPPEDDKIPTIDDVQAYIQKAAKTRSIDPNVAIKVAQGEGLYANPKEGWQSNIRDPKTGAREESYSPYQLNMKPGAVGDKMLKETGIDPRNPQNWQQSVDYALDTAKKGGWSPWMGAKAKGVSNWQGIGDFDAKITPAGDVITDTKDASMKAGAHAGAAVAESQGSEPFGSKKHQRNLIETIMNRDLSDNAKQAVLAASLALMGGRSPWLGVNLGEAGRAGMAMYYNTMAQERETAKTAAEVGKTVAETGKTEAETGKTNIGIGLDVYDRWLRYRTSSQLAGKPFLPFDEFKKAVIGNVGSVVGQPQAGPSAPVTPVESAPLDSSGKAITPVLSTEEKPVAQGSLPYWQGILNQASEILQDPQATQTPEQAKAVQDRLAVAQDAIGKIQNTDFYKSAEDFQTQYGNQREGLVRLAKLYEDYAGGRAAPSMSNVIGTLQSFGVDVPNSWADQPSKYDEAMKLAYSQIIAQTINSGLLRAPGKALDAEQKIAAVPDLDPVARYQMIRKTVAGLDYMHDLYDTWDQTLNTLGHIQEFDKENPFDKYYKELGPNGKSALPLPKTFPGQVVPGQENKAASEITDDQALQTLNTHFGDAKDGTQKWLGTRAFIKTPNGWERAQ